MPGITMAIIPLPDDTDKQTHIGRIPRYIPTRIPTPSSSFNNPNFQLRLQLQRTIMGILNLA
jgi:hypothetical protein